jgi:hypothetical protein
LDEKTSLAETLKIVREAAKNVSAI